MALTEYLISMAFALFTAITFIVAGAVLIKHSDMEINDSFGYRTQRSVRNQETWRFANKLSGKLFIIGGIIGLALIIAAALIMKYMGVSERIWLVGCILELVIVFTVIPIIIVFTEKQLIKRFDDKEKK